MKTFALNTFMVFCFLLLTSVTRAQHAVTKLWQTDTILAVPESVLPGKGVLYVSQIGDPKNPTARKGGVAQLSPAGKVLKTDWITGLQAPKGMAQIGNLLYVADVNELVVVDIKKGLIDHKITFSGNPGLNDVTADKNGIVYVTDPRNGSAYKVEGDKYTLFLEGLKGINGIKAVDDKIYVLTADGIYLAGNDKTATKICTLEYGGDGIEPIGNGDFLVTSWVGYLYYVHADGTKDLLLDTHESNNKTADIGYDPKAKIIYVPTFYGKSVAAYKLN
ncbi:SMP-30/gluconolactonase/LRE family protein [Mucilaginibacter pedocola]|uniref:ATP/GTP-binding protein n=1 Tax=Mucilaginibacter pedocola TaxID=1792845 RepID=A0A1S9P9Q1_9SPHI|nr:hypothetical protein [Mucilaginibacter pedocola]OOQ57716.1 hypothetical protein BC343_13045 [Mucilaginibacter pedocola]